MSFFSASVWRHFHRDLWSQRFHISIDLHFNNTDSKYSLVSHLTSLDIPFLVVRFNNRIWIAPDSDTKPLMWNEVNLEIVQLWKGRMCWIPRKWSCLLWGRFLEPSRVISILSPNYFFSLGILRTDFFVLNLWNESGEGVTLPQNHFFWFRELLLLV